jgi:striatin 1/3/4
VLPLPISTVSGGMTTLHERSSKQLSQPAPLASQSIPPAKVASVQSASQKDETSSHKEGSSPSSPRSEGIHWFGFFFTSFTDLGQDSPLPPERGSNGATASGSTRASAWAGPSSLGWTNTNGPASSAAIGKPSLGRDPKSRARSRDYLKQYVLSSKARCPFLIYPPDAFKKSNILPRPKR